MILDDGGRVSEFLPSKFLPINCTERAIRSARDKSTSSLLFTMG